MYIFNFFWFGFFFWGGGVGLGFSGLFCVYVLEFMFKCLIYIFLEDLFLWLIL